VANEGADIQTRFGRKLRELRLERGLSQSTLAERANVTPEHVSRMERGVVSPSLDVVGRLARALSLEPKALFDFASPRGSPDTSLAQLADLARQGSLEDRRLLVRLAETVIRYRGTRRT